MRAVHIRVFKIPTILTGVRLKQGQQSQLRSLGGGSPRVSGRRSPARLGEAPWGPSYGISRALEPRILSAPFQAQPTHGPHPMAERREAGSREEKMLCEGAGRASVCRPARLVNPPEWYGGGREREDNPPPLPQKRESPWSAMPKSLKQQLCEHTYRQDLVMKNVFVLTQEQCRLQSTYNPSPSAELLLGQEMLDPNYGKQDPTSMSLSYGKVTLLQVGSPPSSLIHTQKIRCIHPMSLDSDGIEAFMGS